MIYILLILIICTLAIFLSFSSGDRKILFRRAKIFDHNGTLRSYRIFIPAGLNNHPKLILAFHGYNSNSWQMAYTTGLHNFGNSRSIVVYPDASKPTKKSQKTGWNAGFCCGSGYVNNIDDVGFIHELTQSLVKKYNIDKDKIFAAGFSNGGMFINRLASEQAGEFGAFAAVAGSIGTAANFLTPHNPVPILLIHGEKDQIVPFNGGPGGSDPSFKWRGFSETKTAWEKANKVSRPLVTNEKLSSRTVYENHDDPLEIITYKNMGHSWPDWRLLNFWHKKPKGSQIVLDFFGKI